jgi:diacylglycerol kinase
MEKILRRHHVSFKNAFSGVWFAFTTQPNFLIHLSLSILVILMGFYYRITRTEWLILVFTIIWGLATEMLNTAVEAVTDLVTKEWRMEAKIAKDVSAGMMLIVATGSIVVACVIFLPRIFS